MESVNFNPVHKLTTSRLIRSIFVLVFMFSLLRCHPVDEQSQEIITGAARMDQYLPLIEGKNVGLVVNHTSRVGETHLLDTLLKREIDVTKLFAPEHGVRGDVERGQEFGDDVDKKTGTPVVSLYGRKKIPDSTDLAGLDVVIFDIQDVGVRFYSYISIMHNVMESCARFGVDFMVLDRPNPNGDYFDGPVLDLEFRSFIGKHEIPVVHGLTVGELARMINGEGWLKDELQADLTVIPVENYTHQTPYSLPLPPSPNLPNDLSIRLYPSLCFFEETKISVGRGTDFPFQVIGIPDSSYGDFTFKPRSIPGAAAKPLYMDELCYGIDFRQMDPVEGFTMKYVIEAWEKYPSEEFFNERWFNILAGTDELLIQIKEGRSEAEIRDSWKSEHEAYSEMRQQYLLYPE